MGNTHGANYLDSNRLPLTYVQDSGFSYNSFRTETQQYVDTINGNILPVVLNSYMPRGFSGLPVHRMLTMKDLNPYQIQSVDHPDGDEWYVENVVPYVNAFLEFAEPEQASYIYVISQTGYSILSESGNAIFPNEFEPGNVMLNDVDYSYPRLVVRKVEDFKFSYTLDTNSTTKRVDYIDFNNQDYRMYKFMLIRAQLLSSSDSELMSHFYAQLHCYLYMTVYSQHLMGYNPFSPAEVSTKLSYPYQMLADLILIDNYYSIKDGFSMILVTAMYFIRGWARQMWDFVNTAYFHYGYLDMYYAQAAKGIQSKIEASFISDLKTVEGLAMLRFQT